MNDYTVEITDYEMYLLAGFEDGSLTTDLEELCENLEGVYTLEQKGFIVVADNRWVTLTDMGQDCVDCY
jgi:hypothetical protein